MTSRRRTPPGMASACAAKAAQDEIARRLFHPSAADLEALAYHLTSCCGKPPEERVAYFLAAVGQRIGLADPAIGEVH